jgi:hypothetical protein
MAHAWYHALSSARRHGGRPEDYLSLHSWFDSSKQYLADFRHRALRHHTQGVFEAERIFGSILTNSAGRRVPARDLAEQHVCEDCGGQVPTLADWLARIEPAPWMSRAARLSTQFAPFMPDASAGRLEAGRATASPEAGGMPPLSTNDSDGEQTTG